MRLFLNNVLKDTELISGDINIKPGLSAPRDTPLRAWEIPSIFVFWFSAEPSTVLAISELQLVICWLKEKRFILFC